MGNIEGKRCMGESKGRIAEGEPKEENDGREREIEEGEPGENKAGNQRGKMERDNQGNKQRLELKG